MLPTKTFIIPTYNPDIEYLKIAIISIINQMTSSDILQIHDDRSQNIGQISKLCQNLQNKFSENEIVFIAHNENVGITKGLNRALQYVDTPFFAIFGQDDVSKYDLPWDKYDQLLLRNLDIDVFLFRTEFIDANDRVISPITQDTILSHTYYPTRFSLALGWGNYKNKIVYAVQGAFFRTGNVKFDERFPTEDHPIFLEKATTNSVLLSNFQSSQYRRHHGQSTANVWSFLRTDINIVWQYLPIHQFLIVAVKKIIQRIIQRIKL